MAVKVFSKNLGDDITRKRFFREARVLADLDHEHVVSYVAHGEDEVGRPFLAVRWLDGEDLASRQRRAPLDVGQALALVRKTASAIAYLHGRGVLHRDVKPSNLFVSERPDGELDVTIIDLGVAFAEDAQELTLHGSIVGTPSYLSPELITGERPTVQVDVFSLGVVLYELLARDKAYRGETAFAVIAKIVLVDPPRLAITAPHLPLYLDELVAGAMAKRPSERFATIEQFARAVGEAEARWSTERPTDPPPRPVSAPPFSEPRIVTAVFASSSTVAQGDLAAAFERVVEKRGGTSFSLLGRVRVGLFGAKKSRGDEHHHATDAALEIAHEVPGTALSIVTGRMLGGAGVLSGDAVERGVALLAESDEDARAFGGRHSIRADEVTARLLGDSCFVPGSERELLVFAGREGATRLRTFLGKPTPCVGREIDLDALRVLAASTFDDRVAHLAIVSGPAGIGKSRIRYEFLRGLRESPSPPAVLFGRAGALSDAAPFGLLASLIRAGAGIQEGEDVPAALVKLEASFALSNLDAARTRELATALARIASLDDLGTRRFEDGMVERDLLLVAFETWLSSQTRVGNLVIVLEDAHLADRASLAFVDAVFRNLVREPIFVLVCGRPELFLRLPAGWETHRPLVLRLGELSREASLRLARTVLAPEIPEETVGKIVDRAGGNAFFLEELLRGFATGGGGGSLSQLPETVLGVMQSRLDALGPNGKRVLRAGAVFGASFCAGAVAYLLDVAAEDLRFVLRGLCDREVIEKTTTARVADREEYVFRHAILRDVAYELWVDEERRLAHERAAAWLEANGERHRVVEHLERAGHPEFASTHLVRAAEDALVGSDFAGAVALAERALAFGLAEELTSRAQLTRAEAARWGGDLETALAAAGAAQSAASSGSREWFAALRERIAAYGRLGQIEAILPAVEEAFVTPARDGATSARIAALVPAAVHCLYAGNLGAATALSGHIETLASTPSALEPSARARLHQLRAALALHFDDVEHAIGEQERAHAEFGKAGDARGAALVSSNLGFTLLSVGQNARAEIALRRAHATAMRLGLRTIGPLAEHNLGVVLFRTGRADEACDLMTAAAERFRDLRDPRLEGATRVHLARCLVGRHELGRARAEALSAIERAPEAVRVGAHAALAQLMLLAGDPVGALAEAETAMRLYDKLGKVEDFEMFARATYVEVLGESGRTNDARRAHDAAMVRLQERLGRLADPDLRRTFMETVPEHWRLVELGGQLHARR